MSVAAHFHALAAGRRPADDGLLGNTLLEWGAGEAYGEEAILELFRAAPFAPGDGAVLIESARSVAWVGADAALVADLYDGRIGRLWRLGPGAPPAAEPAVAVAFDPDLQQQRGEVYARADDHPDLAATAIPQVLAVGEALIALLGPAHRARAFLTRAFSADRCTVALFAIHHLSAGAVRTAGYDHALALIDGETVRLIGERAARAPWTPRL
ncbi:hypothetical protein [Sphingomonas sp.]|uniref:hypothetical protein n=1 Tax=Sphingomonas sp. TaxID=28214 RepID=UPI003CC595A1